MKLRVKRLNPEAKLPVYAHDHDAGMDIFSLEDVTVQPGQVAKIRTGISLEIPPGYVGLCWDKSGLSMNHGIKSLGGVVDSGYRGELVVGVINLGKEAYTFEKGHKVVQMLIQKVEHMEVLESEELSGSARGGKGFGSTGK